MSENVVPFFELIADATGFDAGFTAAEKKALAFAAEFKGVAASVSADADRMGAAIERSVAVGSLSRGAANQLIGQRLNFYGASGGGAAAAAGGVEMGSLLGGLAVPAAVLGGVGLLIAELAKAEEGFANESAQILRNSEAIGMNAQDLQTWDKIAQVVGLDQQSMVLDFERFAKNLEEGAPALKATGLTLKDLGITSTDVGTSILQLADYFHTHRDAAMQSAVAQALFGRSGSELIPILDQGSAAFVNYRGELEKMGALLSNSDLFAGAQAQVAIEQFSTAFEVAKDKLLAAALPGFTMFFEDISQILVNNGQVWTEIGKVIGEVVSFILGIVQGLSGDPTDLSKAPQNAQSHYQGLAGTANDAAGGINNAAAASKRMTDAIDDQIAALQEEKRAQDEVYDAQKAALQDQLDTLRDVVDTRRRQGEDIVSYERRLEELGIQDKIKGVDKAKTAYDQQVDDHIAALQRERQEVAKAGAGMGNDLAAGVGGGMAKAIASSLNAVTQIDQDWVKLGSDLGKLFLDLFSKDKDKREKAARELGADLGNLFGQAMLGAIGAQLKDAGGNILKAQSSSTWTNETFGQKLESLAHALTGHAEGGIFTAEHVARISEGGRAEAVIPLTDRTRAMSLMETSGLAAMARGGGGSGGSASGGASGRGGGDMPPTIVNFNGPVATEYVADRVYQRIDREQRRRGFLLSRGFGS